MSPFIYAGTPSHSAFQQQPQSLPPSTGNTSVAPRQRPRGSKPAAAKSILPLPPAGTSPTAGMVAPPPAAAAAAMPIVAANSGTNEAKQRQQHQNNPFKADFVPVEQSQPVDR